MRPHLIVCDEAGTFIELDELNAAGMSFVKPRWPHSDEMAPLPPGTQMMALPGRVAIGFDPALDKFVQLRSQEGRQLSPVAAVLPDGYVQLYRCAYSSILDSPRLPQRSFTAAGILDGTLYAAAAGVEERAFGGRPAIVHPVGSENGDPRWLDDAASFLENAEGGVLELRCTTPGAADLLAGHADELRALASKGVLHVSLRDPGVETAVPALLSAGVNSFSVALNSVQRRFYDAYHRESAVRWESVETLLRALVDAGAEVMLDYEVFPGLTDHPSEFEQLPEFMGSLGLSTLRLHNLAADPEWYLDELHLFRLSRNQIGISRWLTHIMEQPLEVCA